MKVALRRLRKLIRDSADEEFDLDNTISSTAKKAGLLDVKFRPEKRKCSKSHCAFDVGGSMDIILKFVKSFFCCKNRVQKFRVFLLSQFYL